MKMIHFDRFQIENHQNRSAMKLGFFKNEFNNGEKDLVIF